MNGWLFFVSLLGFALMGMLLFPRLRVGAALLCSLCFMLFVAFYGCIMAEIMTPTACALMYGGLGCAVIGAVGAALNWRGLRQRALSPSLLIYLLLAVLAVITARHTLIQDHDSLSYWARAVKELFTFERFYIHADSTMFHMDYIPLLASLQYSIVRVFGWQDAFLTYVCAACVAASIAALCDLAPKRWMIPLMAALLFYAYGVFGFGLLDLRADGPMLLIFAAGLLTLLAREDDQPTAFLPALCVCAVLTGFKIYSGLMFAVIIAAAMLTESLHQHRHGRDCRPCHATVWMTVAAAASIVLLQMGWSIRYNAAVAAAKSGADVALDQLLSGNPRTAQLLQSFTEEKLAQFWELAAQTLALYGRSQLVWMWPFALAALALSAFAPREKRAAVRRAFLWLFAAAIVYLLGLFGSYLVQAETFGAATTYLATASAPLMIAAVFFVFWLARGQMRTWGMVAAAGMTAGMIALFSPVQLWPNTAPQEYELYAGMAYEFYTEEIEGQLTEADAGKHALLIDCSYAASEVKSQSGKTHAYAYFALPVRVEEPIYYAYGDYTQLEDGIDGEEILRRLQSQQCELLILRIEDELYWDEIASALDLYGDSDGPVGVYDVTWEDGCAAFAFRGEADVE